jgi:hypothetical protein
MEWWDGEGFIPILPSFQHSVIPYPGGLNECAKGSGDEEEYPSFQKESCSSRNSKGNPKYSTPGSFLG